MVLNIAITQGLKRLFHRSRPIDFHPTAPRAKKLVETDKLGSLPSNMIVLGTTFTFALLATDTWAKHFTPLNSIDQWAAGLIAVAMYLLLSFLKVHLGQNYPSDCILSAPPILAIVGLWYLWDWLEKTS